MPCAAVHDWAGSGHQALLQSLAGGAPAVWKELPGCPPPHEGLWAREVHEASRAVGGIEFVSFVAHTLCTPDPLWASVAGPAFAHFLEPYPDSMSSRLP